MAHRYYQLPALTALTAFEASARHRSFKLAAAEMNVTPGAISRQIKGLEEGLNVPLFVRGSTGIALTPEAEELYAVISNGFSRAAQAVQRIRGGNRARHVTLACTNAFATMWLMPRMGDFWRRFPDICVDHLISDNAREFRRAEVDLRIRYGSGAWPDETSRLLLDETVFPICSPRFAERHPGAVADDIPRLPLLHVGWADPEWTDWDELLRRAAIPHGHLSGRRMSKFAVTMQACQDDQGVAVGWHRLVKDSIAQGKIVAFTDLRIPAPGGYHLTWNDNRELTPAAAKFQDWLVDMAAADVP